MVSWLKARGVNHDQQLTKPELYEIVKNHKDENPSYRLDTLLEEKGHKVLRLPPYHPELNPIEKIWACVKDYVATRNTKFTLQYVEELAREKFEAITAEDWAALCEHCNRVAEEYMKKDNIVDDAIEKFIINVGSDDSEEESEVEEEDD